MTQPLTASPMTQTTIEKCFAVTAAFEGGGYGSLCGNFDGQGVSFGFLQWNLGQGTLQCLLKDMVANGSETFKRCCTVVVNSAPFNGKSVDLSADLLNVCNMANADAVHWFTERQDSHHQLLPHWQSVFHNLAAVPGYQAVQRHHADAYMMTAKGICLQYGFESERGLALAFDIAVQMGSISDGSRQRYLSMPAAEDEATRLQHMAVAVAPQGGQWASDVLSRKMTIAKGGGTVHGRYYDLARDFGLTMAAITT